MIVDVIYKRPPRFLKRKTGNGGALIASDSLANIIDKKPVGFRCKTTETHIHRFLHGLTHSVCAECGLTIKKEEIPPQSKTHEIPS